MGSPYTIFIVSALVIAGWLGVLALFVRGRGAPAQDAPPPAVAPPVTSPPARPHG